MLPSTHQNLTLPDLPPEFAGYSPTLAKLVKSAWYLECQETESVSKFQTHIGGTNPFVPVEEGWPYCQKCENPLTFIWQINFSEFGVGAFAEQGLFQFFYCWVCFPLPRGSYEDGIVCRWYPDFEQSKVADVPLVTFPAQNVEAITSYQVEIVPFLSLPSYGSSENPISENDQNRLMELDNQKTISYIAGYPQWIQYEEFILSCPVCGKQAEFVGAVGDYDTNISWGDTGYWYFFACKATSECHGLTKPLMNSQCC